MESYLSPNDPLFKVFEVLGIIVMIAVVIIGSIISYDWWKEKKEREGENG